jgi:predicted acyl esterase
VSHKNASYCEVVAALIGFESEVWQERAHAKRANRKMWDRKIKTFRLRDLLAGASTVVKIEPNVNDRLVYKTPPMNDPIEIGGPIDLDLYFSTSAKDTDFFASLVDIDEKGEMRSIGIPGKLRARYLSGWEKPEPLQPGKAYKASIALWDTAHQVKKGPDVPRLRAQSEHGRTCQERHADGRRASDHLPRREAAERAALPLTASSAANKQTK